MHPDLFTFKKKLCHLKEKKAIYFIIFWLYHRIQYKWSQTLLFTFYWKAKSIIEYSLQVEAILATNTRCFVQIRTLILQSLLWENSHILIKKRKKKRYTFKQFSNDIGQWNKITKDDKTQGSTGPHHRIFAAGHPCNQFPTSPDWSLKGLYITLFAVFAPAVVFNLLPNEKHKKIRKAISLKLGLY